jgi:26S proteasome regulatory subunit N1
MAVKEDQPKDTDKAKDGKAKDGAKKDAKEEEPELSEEDMELKKNLEMMIERVGEEDPGRPP